MSSFKFALPVNLSARIAWKVNCFSGFLIPALRIVLPLWIKEMYLCHMMMHWKFLLVAIFSVLSFHLVIAQKDAEVVPGTAYFQKLMQKGAYAQVVEEAEKVILENKVRDSLGQYLLWAGRALLEMDSVDRAKSRFTELLSVVKSQSKPNPLLHAGALSGMGECFIRKGNYTTGMEYYRLSLRLREDAFGKLSEATAIGYNDLGYAQLLAGDNEAAFRLLTQGMDIRQALRPEDQPDLAGSFLNLGACMLDREKFEEAVWYYSKALELRSALLGAAHPKTAEAQKALARAYFKVGENSQALKGYKEALEIQIQLLGPQHPALAPVYEQIGDVLLDQYASREAEVNFAKAAALYPPQDNRALALLDIKIGHCLQARGEDRPALGKYLGAFEVMEQFPGSTSSATFGGLLLNIGEAYLKLGAYREALPMLQRAVRIFQSTARTGSPELVQCLNAEAVCHLLLGRPDMALATAQRAETLLESAGVFTATSRAMLLRTKARAHFAQEKYDVALNMTRNALGLLWPDRNVNKVNRVIAPEIVNLLVLEAKLMPRTGSRYADAAALLETALQLFRRLFLGYSEEARWEWNTVSFSLYTEAVDANFQAWKFSGSRSYLVRALQISEQFKQERLTDAVYQTRASRFRGIAPRLLNEQRSLETSLFQLEKQRWSAAAKERGILESRLAEEIAVVRENLENLRRELSLESSDFTRFLDRSQSVRLDEMRGLLAQDQALLEYFISENQVFLFLLTRDTFHGFRIPKYAALENGVSEFLLMNSKYPTLKAKFPERYAADWARLAHRLYRQLLEPVVEEMVLPRRLIIVPDGILYHLPFEALLSKPPENPTEFRDHAYLLNTYSISYAYSAKALRESRSLASRGRFWGKYLLTMAPVFKENGSGLSPLFANLEESSGLKKLYGGRMLSGPEATLENFMDLAPEFRVLHLATHGKAASGGQENSYVAFTERRNNKEDRYLLASDLFNMRLRTDLVVLSGNEAKIGEFRKGEGVLGMGYGFLYAGAKSLMSSLWNPNQSRSSQIVIRCFYYLRKGLPKDIALQQAKKEFLEQNPQSGAHPFYWAGLQLNGDTSALPDPRLKWLLAWLIAIAGLGLAVFLYWKWVRPREN